MKAETKSPLKKNGAADSKLSGRIWFNICLFGFTGQMAWTLENMYFNTFLYPIIETMLIPFSIFPYSIYRH